jgi:hypothetical protein
VCDIKEAYGQYPQTSASAKLHGVKIMVKGLSDFLVTLVVFFLVGAWGFTRAGNIFCLVSDTIRRIHNAGLSFKEQRSLIYIDDGIMCDEASEIFADTESFDENKFGPCVTSYISICERFFGAGCCHPKKTKLFRRFLVAIGWEIDLKEGTALPSKKGQDKLLVRLFRYLPMGSDTISLLNLDKLTGSLVRYSQAMVSGSSFVGSLFKCQNRAEENRYENVKLSKLCLADIEMWRALTLVMIRYPNLIGGSIWALRTTLTFTRWLRTDASSLIGGGAILSSIPFTKENPFGKEISCSTLVAIRCWETHRKATSIPRSRRVGWQRGVY